MLRFIIILLLAISCSHPISREYKNKQDYPSEIKNPEIKVITDEYFKLSTWNNIHFSRNVSIGFTEIRRDNVIGTCTYGMGFREIDLDSIYWGDATWTSKIALAYHELTHCYCGRDHDFDDGEKYPNDSLKSIIKTFFYEQKIVPLKLPGYLDDSCPKSIMHPIILSDECFSKHYSYYVKEMFSRCNPW